MVRKYASLRDVAIVATGLLSFGGALKAQGVSPHSLSRTDLEAEVRTAETQHKTSEAWLLRARLQNGDFQEGDRIVVVLDANPRPDTMLVRAGKVLQFVGMSDLSLVGVLRSELTDTLRGHLSKYLRNPDVRATPLLPLAVLGSVVTPGYYYTAADVVLRDVIMRAGGPQPSADLSKAVIRRGGVVIWSSKDVRTALSDGLAIDQLHLRAGDEFYVPERRNISFTSVVALLSSALAVTMVIAR
jgi:hypothetical protein